MKNLHLRLAVCSLLPLSIASAATSTWTGGYAPTGTWSQATNWGGTAFANNNDVVFELPPTSTILGTFVGAARTVKSITFKAGAPAYSIRLATGGGGGTAANLSFNSTNTGVTVESGNSSAHSIGVSDGSIALAGNMLVTHNGTGTLTFSRPVTGNFQLTKTGTGLFAVTAANTYSGDTTINDGKLRATVGGSSANSKIVINAASASFSTNVTNNTQSWTCNSFTAAAVGTLEFNFGATLPSQSLAPLTVTNAATFTATPAVSVLVDAGLDPGTYPLMTWASTTGVAPTTANLTISQLLPSSAATLTVSGNTLNLVITSTILSIAKANNTNNLNFGSSWLGGVAPGPGAVAKWNASVTSPNTTALGANLTWTGIAIEAPNGPVTITAGNVLTLGGDTIEIDMTSASTADLSLNCALALGAPNVWDVASARTLTVAGQVSGGFGVTKQGLGTAVLSSPANNYTGNTTITAGTLRLGATQVLPDGAGNGNVSINGTLNLNGNSETLNGLTGASTGSVDNTATSTVSTLTLGGNDQTSTFSGVLKNTGSAATLNLTKIGTGTQILGSANTLSGAISITAGTLAFSNIAPLASVSGIAIAADAALRPDIVNAVIAAPISLGAGTVTTFSTINAPNAPGSGTTAIPFNVEGVISGPGNLQLTGVSPNNAYGAIYLKAANTYTGSTLFTCNDDLAAPTTLGNHNIFVRLFVANALPVTTVLTLDGGDGAALASAPGRYCELNLGGNNQTLAGLKNVDGRNLRVQRVINSSATTATLTINTSASHIYNAQLGWVSGFGSTSFDNFNLTKSGTGTQTFTGPLRYDGHTTVNGGTLSLSSVNPNNEFATVTIAETGATLNLTFAGPDTVDKLFIGGTQKQAGVYGATGSGAQFEISQITGTGTLSVFSSPMGFSSWITGTFANGTIPLADRDANDDFDKDGIANLVEYAIAGQDPTVPATSIGSLTANTLSFTKRTGTSGLTYSIQESTDLGTTDNWTEVPPGPSYTNNATTISSILTPGTPMRNFLRLQVLSN